MSLTRIGLRIFATLVCGVLAVWAWVPFFEPWGNFFTYVLGVLFFLIAVGAWCFMWTTTRDF